MCVVDTTQYSVSSRRKFHARRSGAFLRARMLSDLSGWRTRIASSYNPATIQQGKDTFMSNASVVTRGVAVFFLGVAIARAQDAQPAAAPAAGGESYEDHDMKRPQATPVTPVEPAPDQPAKPPSDAVVLFDGKDLSKWKPEKGDGEAAWKVEDGALVVVPKKGAIETKDQFRDVQLHLEWQHPKDITGKSQGRGNSGVFLMGMYELQVLDNYQAETYPDGMVGGVYGQYPPLVNAARPPGQWGAYDIIFRAPKYENGKVSKPARVTVLLNGVVVQDNVDLLGPTTHKKLTSYPDKHPEKGPLRLQDHGQPVKFRNIWVRELKDNPVPASRAAGEGH